MTLAIYKVPLLTGLLDLLQSVANLSIGKAWHWGLP